MNFLDILILVFLVIFLLRGYKKGIVSEIFQILGLVIAFYFSAPISDLLSKIIITNFEIDDKIVYFVSGILAFILIIITFLVIGKIVTKVLGIVMLSLPNKIFGAIFGVVKGFLIVTLLVLVIRFTPFENFIYDNIEYNSGIDNTVNKIEKVITETKQVNDKEIDAELAEDIKDATKEVADDITDIEFTSNKSTLGYLAYKISTLLDPVATNIKNLFTQKIQENIGLLDNIKDIIPNTEEKIKE